MPNSVTVGYEFKTLTSNKSMSDLRVQVDAFLNTFVKPSQIVGISYQEEDHPNNEINEFLAFVCFTGSADSEVSKPTDIQGKIFN